MILGQFGVLLTIAGALVLAGIVYALQRLRAQPRVLRLPTAGLWAQAMRAAPVSVLGGRFRYWLAYLLILTIALLLWIAAAYPQLALSAGDRTERFYLDNSALLTGNGDLAAAKRALLADVRATPAARREVFAADARLLAAGKAHRCCRAGSTRWSRATGRRISPLGWRGRELAPRWIITGMACRARRDAQPNRAIWLSRRSGAGQSRHRRPGRDAGGIGRLVESRCDCRARRRGRADAACDGFALDAGWQGIRPRPARGVGWGRYLLRDIAAAGGILGVTLSPGDRFAADDSATLRLPDRRPLRVALLGGTPAAIRAVVQADDSMTLSSPAEAQVVVGDPSTVRGLAKPAFIITDPVAGQPAFVFTGPGEAERGALADRLDQLGLAQIDASALADALHRPIGVDVRDAARRSVAVWRTVFGPDAPAAGRAALPVFVAQSLRWLGRSDGGSPYAEAGAARMDQSGALRVGRSGRRRSPGAAVAYRSRDDVGGRRRYAPSHDQAGRRCLACGFAVHAAGGRGRAVARRGMVAGPAGQDAMRPHP
ncbi:hypothetical protein MOP88_12085 [Sphingomonas sp. WKB10]|nr:hypothetical protein [Sphingomonas sp. WKB10]